MRKKGIYERFVKRPLDFFLSLFSLVILSPLFVLIAVLVKIKLGSPVIYKQKRPGLNERLFTLYKFRTMTDEKDSQGNIMPDELRLTKLGRFLRSTSLDELPGLLNILLGEISIVGPRPLLVEYLDLYDNHQKRRHEVRPGLTGLAQVEGRNELTWKKRLNLDVQYLDHITFISDIKIIIKTFFKVIKRDGISSVTSVTMEKFKGNNTK